MIDKLVFVPKEERTTPYIMTKFEFARIMEIRVTQIEYGSPILVDYTKDMTTLEIAIKELMNKKLNFTIRRYMFGSGTVEEFHVNELDTSQHTNKI